MPLQNRACSKDALAGSVSSSMPNESSPPLVAATMSGRSRRSAPEVTDQFYAGGRKKFSNKGAPERPSQRPSRASVPRLPTSV